MGIVARIIAALGGLSIIMGVLDAGDIFRQSGLAVVDSSFWLLLAIALFLAAIILTLFQRHTS
jgi:hypothetical protein